MQLACNKCGHKWDEAVDDNVFIVQCPDCFATTPLLVAKVDAGPGGASPPVESGTVTAPPPARVVRPPVAAFEETEPVRPARKIEPEPVSTVAAILTPPPQEDPLDISAMATQIELSPFASPTEILPAADETASGTVSPFDATAPVLTRPGQPIGEADTLFEASETELPATKAALPHSPPRPQIRLTRDDTESDPIPGSSPTRTFSMAGAKDVDLTGETIGGYKVAKMLGAGGMGAVCLARQISLDRDVALKILPGKLAQNPEFLVRFTREALSAAQLCHHNIIQVYDVGSDGDVHFISMEYVRGDTLGNMVRREGTLRVDDAASFVLQAARGLKYAHEHGIIHRDIKPDNIMVNEHGIVKIADMGLAKMKGEAERSKRSGALNEEERSLLARARGDLTMTDVAMGTPSYMSPEQARDASGVDSRADQYSLGCTLYFLVAGQPPYSGSSAYEIISQHRDAPLPDLEQMVKNVPVALAAIVRRMLAKDADDRYPDMTEVIRDLEAVLGVGAEKGPYTPREHHLEVLERAQIQFYSVPTLKWRKMAVPAFFALTLLLAAMSVFSGSFAAAGGFLGLMFLTPLFSFVLGGITHKDYLFRRVRSVFFGMPLKEWAMVAGITLLALGMLTQLGLLGWWAGFGVLALLLAAVYQFGIVRRIDRERANPLGSVQEMLKHLRLKGVSEDAIHDFIGRFSGEHWEEMYEALFGYEAMIEARSRIAATDRLEKRKRYAVWREPIARWLEGVEESRRVRREQRQLAKVEAKRLKAQGASEREAMKRAKLTAVKMHDDIKSEAARAETKAAAKAKVEKGKPEKKERVRPTKRTATPGDNLFRAVRFVAGAFIAVLYVVYQMADKLPPSLAPFAQKLADLPMPNAIQIAIFSLWGALAAGFLILSAFSIRKLTGILVTVGAVAILAAYYIGPALFSMGLLGDLDQYHTLAVALMGAGILWAGLGRMSGREF